MAYVTGFFAADGYITVNRRGGQFWCIQIVDRDLLYKIKEALKSDHKIGVRRRNEGRSVIYSLQIGSAKMCDDLRKIGFTARKAKNLVVPQVPKEFFSHFVRGYFDGDGHVWAGLINKKRKKPTKVIFAAFTSCSKNFLMSLLSILHSMGINGGCIYKAKEGTYYRLSLSTLDALKLYHIMYNETHQIFLKRKKKVFEKFIHKCGRGVAWLTRSPVTG